MILGKILSCFKLKEPHFVQFLQLLYNDASTVLFKGGNDCMYILVDANWPMWDEKEKSMAKFIGEVGLAIAI